MNNEIKIYRGYLRNTGFSDLQMNNQREQILKKLQKKYWVEEKLTHRVTMQKQDEVCWDHSLDLITLMGRMNVELSLALWRNGDPDPKKPRVILYWYIDTVNRDGFEELLYDLKPKETVLTMDFTLPEEILENPQFDLIKARGSQLPSLFHLIRDLKRQKYSSRKISDQIKSRKGVNMSHVTVNRIINENNWVL